MKNLIKISASALILSIYIFCVVAFEISRSNNDQPATTAPAPYVHAYETDEQFFYQGEILMPDYVHIDTLIVTNAQLLNDSIICNYDLASDQEINDMLIKGTILYSNHTTTASK